MCEQGLFTALDACEERQFVFMADRVLTRLQKRTHVFENKKANEKRDAGHAHACISWMLVSACRVQ